ncbi:hypothetical protein [Glutamicibacter soli]
MNLNELTDAVESGAIGPALDKTVDFYLKSPEGNFSEIESVALCQAASLEKSCVGGGTIFALVQMLFLERRLQAPTAFTDWLFSPEQSDENASVVSDLILESTSIEFHKLFIKILFGETEISLLARFEEVCRSVAQKNISDIDILANDVTELIESYLPFVSSLDNVESVIENLYSIHRLLRKSTGLHNFASSRGCLNGFEKNLGPFCKIVDLIDSLTESPKVDFEIGRHDFLRTNYLNIDTHNLVTDFIPFTEITLVENLVFAGHLALARKVLIAYRERFLNFGYSNWVRNFEFTIDLLESFVYGSQVDVQVPSECILDDLIVWLTRPSEPKELFDACYRLLTMKQPLVREFFERNRKVIFSFESLLTSEVQQKATVCHYLQILFMRSLGNIVDRRLSVRMSRVLETVVCVPGSSVCDTFIFQIRMDECASLNLLGRDREAAEGYSKIFDELSDDLVTSVLGYTTFSLLINSLHNMNAIDDILTYINSQKLVSLYTKRNVLSDFNCLIFEISLLEIFVAPDLSKLFTKILTADILLSEIICKIEKQDCVCDLGPGRFSTLINTARRLGYQNREIALLNAYSSIDSVFSEIADVRVTQFAEMR